jgi:hypothetical protein
MMTWTNQRKSKNWRQKSSGRLSLLALILIGDDRPYSAFAFDIPSASTATATATARRCHLSTPTNLSNLNADNDDADNIATTILSKTTGIPVSSMNFVNLQHRAAVVARRPLLSVGAQAVTSTILSALLLPSLFPSAAYADFAPGGTLLDREVSITYGNLEASPSRMRDNSNVLFPQDNYYKFGAAARWILPPGSTDYPLTVPFVPSQRRYDALKKYGPKVKQSVDAIARIGSSSAVDNIPERTDPLYQLRSLGLIADSFLASDNTGTTNELMLARWYINEMYLRIGDYRDALAIGDANKAKACYDCLTKALNSYLSLLNRSITSKVGDQFGYI